MSAKRKKSTADKSGKKGKLTLKKKVKNIMKKATLRRKTISRKTARKSETTKKRPVKTLRSPSRKSSSFQKILTAEGWRRLMMGAKN